MQVLFGLLTPVLAFGVTVTLVLFLSLVPAILGQHRVVKETPAAPCALATAAGTAEP